MRTCHLLMSAALCACTTAQNDTGPVTWSGYIFADPYLSEDLLTGGTFDVLDTDGECLVNENGDCIVGEESTTDGYWSVSVPRSEPVALRLAGPGLAPTVWRTDTPSRSAQWLNGGLFARDLPALDAFAADLGAPWAAATSLSEGSVAWMWGAPLDPAAWAGATLTVVDGNGVIAPVVAFSEAEDGSLTLTSDGPIDLFLAVDLSPGTVSLSVQPTSGEPVEVTWPARGGDLLSAVYIALPTRTP